MNKYRKNAYRHLLYHAMLDIRTISSWSSIGFGILNPFTWFRAIGDLYKLYVLSNFFHNLAIASRDDFCNFNESIFWKYWDEIPLNQRTLFDYKELFEKRLEELQYKILFVENDTVFAETVTREFLSDEEVEIVTELQSAKSQLAENVYDIILLDDELDDGKGIDLLDEITKRKYAKVIAISSENKGNKELFDGGAEAICNKTNFSAILSVIERVVEKPLRYGFIK